MPQIPALIVLGAAFGLAAGWVFGRWGWDLIVEDSKAGGEKRGWLYMLLGWLAPVAISFIGFILAYAGEQGGFAAAAGDAEQGMGTAMGSRGMMAVLVSQVAGLIIARIFRK